ncbi:MAG: hypothetical protein U5K51_14270 [Flavobacteriaceae bacterium]|nr:hypothetical protein [Flavobacteriaceae bacterium]
MIFLVTIGYKTPVLLQARPLAEVQFAKKSLKNIIVNFEQFISIKGIKSLGNQLTADKIKDVNLLESLPSRT